MADDSEPKTLVEGEDYKMVPTGMRDAETDAPILGRQVFDAKNRSGISSESTRGGFLRRVLPWAR